MTKYNRFECKRCSAPFYL